MPWYKIEISYGPGGQGHDTLYEYASGVMCEEDEREMCQEAVETHPEARYSDRARADSQLVEKLPEDVRQEKVKHYERHIESARQMLLILEKS